MATAKNTRARQARSDKPPTPASSPPAPLSARHELAGIRNQVAIAASAASVCGAALAAQSADFDRDAALVLQRCVGDVLAVQIEHLDSLSGGGAP